MPARHRRQRPSQFRCRAPQPRQAASQAEYFTKRTLLSFPHGPCSPMDPPGRRYLCARCRTAVIICSHCDRGQRYCTATCADQSRRNALRQAGQRYQRSRPGRHAHAERQRCYRARRQEVTHQGSPPCAPPVPLPSEPMVLTILAPWHCCRCRRPLSEWVRQDFLRCRIRRNRLHRSTHDPHPRN